MASRDGQGASAAASLPGLGLRAPVPSFDVGNLGHVLIVLSFAATPFFVVTVWLSYGLLIDARGHLLRAVVTYALLAGTSYYVTVTVRWTATSQPWSLHALLVVVTSGLLVVWNARRLHEMKAKAVQAPAAGAVQT